VELDQASLTHALRELDKLGSVTYVPPFRGRAIRMINRDLPFEELAIDFESVERLRATELEKLSLVMSFATSHECRQQAILDYFGDTARGPCRHCDNCRRSGLRAASPPAAVDEKTREAVRMALSGVARVKRQLGLSCGKNLIAQMLCGSASARMARLGLNRLSTFGLLRRLPQSDVVLLLDALVVAGLLEQSEPQPRRPVVGLTAAGTEVMKAKAAFPAALPIPPDVAAKIRGEAAWRAWEQAPSPAAGASPGLGRPTHYWTWRLLSGGFTLEECCAIRGLDRQAVLGHALRAAEEGLAVRAAWCLSAGLIAALESLVAPGADPPVRDLLRRLPPDTLREEVALFLRCRRTSG